MGVNELIKIGTRIRRIRLDRGLTQKEVSQRLGIPYSTYSNYENNNREPSYETIVNIAKILNTSINEILYSKSGLITEETAEYLITLAGYTYHPIDDGSYLIQEINDNKVIKGKVVSNDELNKFVDDISKYIEFSLDKMLN